MARSLNRVQLIGNLTRDPELRYTPSGAAVCSFSLATNRTWTTEAGEKKEEADFHRIVAWNKLGELCSQFLVKGRKVYVEGRLQTRAWTAQDGTSKSTTEVVIDDMILLDNKRQDEGGAPRTAPAPARPARGQKADEGEEMPEEKAVPGPKKEEKQVKESADEEVMPDDIPF